MLFREYSWGESSQRLLWGLKRRLGEMDRIRSGDRINELRLKIHTLMKSCFRSRPILKAQSTTACRVGGIQSSSDFPLKLSALLTACSAHPLWRRTSNSEIRGGFPLHWILFHDLSSDQLQRSFDRCLSYRLCPFAPFSIPLPSNFPKYTLDSFFILKALLITSQQCSNTLA